MDVVILVSVATVPQVCVHAHGPQIGSLQMLSLVHVGYISIV